MSNNDEKIESMLKHYRPLGPPAELKERIFQSKEKQWNRTWLAVAASIFLVASFMIWQTTVKPPKQEAAVVDIEHYIAVSASAARILAAAEILEQYEDTQQFAEKQYRYVASKYSETAAGAEARMKIR